MPRVCKNENLELKDSYSELEMGQIASDRTVASTKIELEMREEIVEEICAIEESTQQVVKDQIIVEENIEQGVLKPFVPWVLNAKYRR